jgi:hypothetical protein
MHAEDIAFLKSRISSGLQGRYSVNEKQFRNVSIVTNLDSRKPTWGVRDLPLRPTNSYGTSFQLLRFPPRIPKTNIGREKTLWVRNILSKRAQSRRRSNRATYVCEHKTHPWKIICMRRHAYATMLQLKCGSQKARRLLYILAKA